MPGIDTLLAKSLSAIFKKKIDEKIIKKFERRLFEKHGMSIKQSIEHFQKFDGILKEFVGSEAEDLEKKCMQKVSTFKKSKRKNCYLITINDSSLAEFMLNCWGDDKTRRILNVVLDKPLTIAQILTACGLTRTSGYREIKSLVINGMLVKYDMIISEGKKVPKYKMVFDSVTIKIDKEKFIINGIINKKIRKEQAKLLQKSIASVSFFEVLAHYVKQGIKNGKK